MSFVDISSFPQFANAGGGGGGNSGSHGNKKQETSWPELINFWKTQDLTEKDKEHLTSPQGNTGRRMTVSGQSTTSEEKNPVKENVQALYARASFSGEEQASDSHVDNETKKAQRGSFALNLGGKEGLGGGFAGRMDELTVSSDFNDPVDAGRKITRTSSETIRRNSADKLSRTYDDDDEDAGDHPVLSPETPREREGMLKDSDREKIQRAFQEAEQSFLNELGSSALSDDFRDYGKSSPRPASLSLGSSSASASAAQSQGSAVQENDGKKGGKKRKGGKSSSSSSSAASGGAASVKGNSGNNKKKKASSKEEKEREKDGDKNFIIRKKDSHNNHNSNNTYNNNNGNNSHNKRNSTSSNARGGGGGAGIAGIGGGGKGGGARVGGHDRDRDSNAEKDEEKIYSFSLGDLDGPGYLGLSKRSSLPQATSFERKDAARGEDNASSYSVASKSRTASSEDDESVESNDESAAPPSVISKRQLFGRKLSFFNSGNNNRASGSTSPRTSNRLSQEMSGGGGAGSSASSSSRFRLALPSSKDSSESGRTSPKNVSPKKGTPRGKQSTPRPASPKGATALQPGTATAASSSASASAAKPNAATAAHRSLAIPQKAARPMSMEFSREAVMGMSGASIPDNSRRASASSPRREPFRQGFLSPSGSPTVLHHSNPAFSSSFFSASSTAIPVPAASSGQASRSVALRPFERGEGFALKKENPTGNRNNLLVAGPASQSTTSLYSAGFGSSTISSSPFAPTGLGGDAAPTAPTFSSVKHKYKKRSRSIKDVQKFFVKTPSNGSQISNAGPQIGAAPAIPGPTAAGVPAAAAAKGRNSPEPGQNAGCHAGAGNGQEKGKEKAPGEPNEQGGFVFEEMEDLSVSSQEDNEVEDDSTDNSPKRPSHRKSGSKGQKTDSSKHYINSKASEILKPSSVKNTKMEGYLHQRNDKGRWKKRWVVLDSRTLYCFKKDVSVPVHTELKAASLKPLGVSNRHCFELKTVDRTFTFDAGTTENYNAWTVAIRDTAASLTGLNSNKSGAPSVGKAAVEEIAKQPGNDTCADCSAPHPEWVLVNVGVFICVDCAGVHKKLLSGVSRVHPINQEKWEEDVIKFLRENGNASVNRVWEAKAVPGCVKPHVRTEGDTSVSTAVGHNLERERYIRAKYERKLMKRDPAVQTLGDTNQRFEIKKETLNRLKYSILTLMREDEEFRDEIRKMLLIVPPSPFASSPMSAPKKNRHEQELSTDDTTETEPSTTSSRRRRADSSTAKKKKKPTKKGSKVKKKKGKSKIRKMSSNIGMGPSVEPENVRSKDAIGSNANSAHNSANAVPAGNGNGTSNGSGTSNTGNITKERSEKSLRAALSSSAAPPTKAAHTNSVSTSPLPSAASASSVAGVTPPLSTKPLKVKEAVVTSTLPRSKQIPKGGNDEVDPLLDVRVPPPRAMTTIDRHSPKRLGSTTALRDKGSMTARGPGEKDKEKEKEKTNVSGTWRMRDREKTREKEEKEREKKEKEKEEKERQEKEKAKVKEQEPEKKPEQAEAADLRDSVKDQQVNKQQKGSEVQDKAQQAKADEEAKKEGMDEKDKNAPVVASLHMEALSAEQSKALEAKRSPTVEAKKKDKKDKSKIKEEKEKEREKKKEKAKEREREKKERKEKQKKDREKAKAKGKQKEKEKEVEKDKPKGSARGRQASGDLSQSALSPKASSLRLDATKPSDDKEKTDATAGSMLAKSDEGKKETEPPKVVAENGDEEMARGVAADSTEMKEENQGEKEPAPEDNTEPRKEDVENVSDPQETAPKNLAPNRNQDQNEEAASAVGNTSAVEAVREVQADEAMANEVEARKESSSAANGQEEPKPSEAVAIEAKSDAAPETKAGEQVKEGEPVKGEEQRVENPKEIKQEPSKDKENAKESGVDSPKDKPKTEKKKKGAAKGKAQDKKKAKEKTKQNKDKETSKEGENKDSEKGDAGDDGKKETDVEKAKEPEKKNEESKKEDKEKQKKDKAKKGKEDNKKKVEKEAISSKVRLRLRRGNRKDSGSGEESSDNQSAKQI